MAERRTAALPALPGYGGARVRWSGGGRGSTISLPALARAFQGIAPCGSRLTDLVAQDGITEKTTGFLVDQLDRARYVQRVPDPAAGRARLVRVAGRGARRVEAFRAIVAQVEAEWTDRLGERRMVQLREILTDLRDITNPWR